MVWKGPRRSKHIAIVSLSQILSFTSVFIVRSGTAWQQDLAILSPEEFRDNTFQLLMVFSASLPLNLSEKFRLNWVTWKCSWGYYAGGNVCIHDLFGGA